jgi:cell cycle sensor histidine kinase DivJ
LTAQEIQTNRAPARLRRPAAAVVVWHAVWLLATGLTVAAHWWWLGGAADRALAYTLVPALAGLGLAGGRSLWRHGPLLLLWAVAGVAASLRLGGLTGPFGVWCLLPLAAACFIGQRRALALGGGLSVAAAALTLGLQVLGQAGSPPAGLDGALLSGFGLASLALSLAAGVLKGRQGREAAGDVARPTGADTSDERLSLFMRGQPLMLLAIDAAGSVRDIAGEAVDGLDPAQLRRQGLLAMVAIGDRPRVDLAIAGARTHGRTDVAFAPAAQLDRWLEAAITRIDGERLVVAIADRTNQHAREASLEQARADAEALNAGKSRFLANMSHELRTPLNAIIGFSDVMRSQMFGPMAPKYAEYAGLIHESGGHLLELINDVLDMSKIEAERFELHREKFDAREAVSASLRLMRLQADAAGVQLRGVLPAQPLLVDADRRAIKQITLNLVSNALKFTGQGGQVIVSLRAQGEEMLELTVSDTGLGIASEDLARLGRPYEQAGEASQRGRGTGLGLSLVRAFAELHGGSLSLESTLGEGTAVTVRMPVLLHPPAAAQPPEPPETPPPSEDPEPPPQPFPPSPNRPAYAGNVIAFDPRR